MLILGIDTGGTYTDGVILDRETRTVLHTAKALTTPENLSAGITACMRALRFSGREQIVMVGLSTTLATNAIVEGSGCRVGLLLLGRQPDGPGLRRPICFMFPAHTGSGMRSAHGPGSGKLRRHAAFRRRSWTGG